MAGAHPKVVIDRFLEDIERVCRKHGLAIADGGNLSATFLVVRWSEDFSEYLMAAENETYQVYPPRIYGDD